MLSACISMTPERVFDRFLNARGERRAHPCAPRPRVELSLELLLHVFHDKYIYIYDFWYPLDWIESYGTSHVPTDAAQNVSVHNSRNCSAANVSLANVTFPLVISPSLSIESKNTSRDFNPLETVTPPLFWLSLIHVAMDEHYMFERLDVPKKLNVVLTKHSKRELNPITK